MVALERKTNNALRTDGSGRVQTPSLPVPWDTRLTGDDEDLRSQPRWSANKKTDAVLRLLRREPLDALSRELGVKAHRLAAWRDDFLEHGKQGLKASPAVRGDAAERRLRHAERKVGELSMENEILRVDR